jgi:hypothetical protein
MGDLTRRDSVVLIAGTAAALAAALSEQIHRLAAQLEQSHAPPPQTRLYIPLL